MLDYRGVGLQRFRCSKCTDILPYSVTRDKHVVINHPVQLQSHSQPHFGPPLNLKKMAGGSGAGNETSATVLPPS